MKRFAFLAIVMALGAGVAFASSLGVPWFADPAGVAQGLPAADGKPTTLIYLHNNQDSEVVCQIQYYDRNGVALGPDTDNTFPIEGNASIAFRPFRDDPATVAGGQEAPSGLIVPNKPITDLDGGANPSKNGSAVVRWFGESTDVQGMVLTTSSAQPYAHLLPPGR